MQKRFFQLKLPTALPYAPFIFMIAGVNIFVLILLIFLRTHLPPEVPLLYGMPQGEDQLMPSIFLVIPTVISLMTVILNVLLMKSVKDVFLQQILVGITGAGTFLSIITTVKILWMVGNF